MNLCESDFGFLWLSQGVGHINDFVWVFRERLIDNRWQNWNDHIQTNDRFDFYRMVSLVRCLRLYMSIDISWHLKQTLAKFRVDLSDL